MNLQCVDTYEKVVAFKWHTYTNGCRFSQWCNCSIWFFPRLLVTDSIGTDIRDVCAIRTQFSSVARLTSAITTNKTLSDDFRMGIRFFIIMPYFRRHKNTLYNMLRYEIVRKTCSLPFLLPPAGGQKYYTPTRSHKTFRTVFLVCNFPILF